MPLREVSAYYEWVANARPSKSEQSIIRFFIAEIGDISYRSPSVQNPDLSEPPIYEVRYALFPNAGNVRVLYVHWYATDNIDLIVVDYREATAL